MSDLLNIVCQTLDEKQAENIVTIDMRSVNPYSDYYVVCTAKNVRHAMSVREFCDEEAEKNGYQLRLREGDSESTWILLDLNEVVIHIFTSEARDFYRLERLWADLPQEQYQVEAE